MANVKVAPGAPGAKPFWSPGAKSAVGTSINSDSKVWFSVGHGIINEVYYPRNDTPAIKDMGFIITDGIGYFSEEKTDSRSKVEWEMPGIPAFKVSNQSNDGRYVIEKTILTDPTRDSMIQQTTIQWEEQSLDKIKLYNLLAPHLGNKGQDNSAWVIHKDDLEILVAKREDSALAMVCSLPFINSSVGYVGVSDGWQDLKAHKKMDWNYDEATNGNVALCSEIDISSNNSFTIVLGFGTDIDLAIKNALDSLHDGFDKIKASYIKEWKDWHDKGLKKDNISDFELNSVAVLKTHQSKNPSGGVIAGLASPWGYSRSDDDPIGYHIVWTRDMVEVAGGLLAAGRYDDIRDMIGYLDSTQQLDGHWPQNMWLSGESYWNGIQMDETALPILLINLARREGAINDNDVLDFWPMTKKAAGYIVRNGPVTKQDRWEEDPGYTPFTLSCEIAALLAAADFSELNQEKDVALYLRQTADNWHDALDRWMFTMDSEWTKKYGINGYYERIALVDRAIVSRFQNTVHVKNVPVEDSMLKAAHLISPDALALVRFGLRRADDPRILNTILLIDKLLKIDTPSGTTWHRYNDDGYGEQIDGSAFNGTGIGRGWPLLSGERGHYELAKGNMQEARNLLQYMQNFACDSSLIPEQVWDSSPISEFELELGRPSGSAMPLAWAHAEYLKLARSIQDGKIFDLPEQTVQRYLVNETESSLRSWRFNHKIKNMEAGKKLRIETLASASVHWTHDGWKTNYDQVCLNSGLGVFYADLETDKLAPGTIINFTFYWENSDHWEEVDYSVVISVK